MDSNKVSEGSSFTSEASGSSGFNTIHEAPNYLNGPGRHDSALSAQWVLGDRNISTSLMRYRDTCVSNNFTALSPEAALSINFIFLFEKEDQGDGLRRQVSDAEWLSIWGHLGTPTLARLPAPTVLEAHEWAGHASSLTVAEFEQELYASPPESPLLRRVIYRLATGEFWSDTFSQEATSAYIDQFITPCFFSVFSTVSHLTISRNRQLHPGLTAFTTVRGVRYTVFKVNGKMPRSSSNEQIWDDVAMLGNEMKLCLDSILSLGPSQPVALHGILIQNNSMRVYRLSLESEGVYVMRLFARCGVCTGELGLPLVGMLEVLLAVKEHAEATIDIIRNTVLHPGEPLVPRSWMRPSFDMPTYEAVDI